MNSTRAWFLFTCLVWAPTSATADPGRGETLHEEHCIACHVSLTGGDASGLYTRENRRINSYPSLHTQVQRCELAQGLQWFEDDIDAVAGFLNSRFYRFE